MYKTFATDSFKKIYESLSGNEQQWIDKTKEKLKESITGKILRYEWFREKKYLNKRLYFIVDEELKRILFLSFASKREQQDIIDFLEKHKEELLKLIKTL